MISALSDPAWFDSHASLPARLAAVRARDHLTWRDLHVVRWSFARHLSSALRTAVAERLDLLSGPYHRTLTFPNGVDLDVPCLLRVLLKPRGDEVTLWTTLMARATPAGRRRLLEAYGDVDLTDGGGYGAVWSPTTWPFLAALLNDSSAAGAPMDDRTAWTLLQVLATGLHHDDRSAVPGEIWARALVACATGVYEIYIARQLEAHTAWFLASPSRLSDAALQTLLEAPSAAVRTWALTHIVPHRSAPPGLRPR